MADLVGIPFYVWDLSAAFEQEVAEDFVAEYARGRTPTRIRCNEKVKFAALLDRALALGFDAVATGHYARIAEGPHGRERTAPTTARRTSPYVLGVPDARQLPRPSPAARRPRPRTRSADAVARGLAVARKPDSHDICFIPDGDTRGFLATRLDLRPGPVVGLDGAIVGEHDGWWASRWASGMACGSAAPPPTGGPGMSSRSARTTRPWSSGRARPCSSPP